MGNKQSIVNGNIADWPLVATIVITFTVVVVTCLATEWNRSDFARHPDEGGHFISGTLVCDWITDGRWTDPMVYAREYYARLPKVAIGHWPPVFYAVQGVWYSLFGVSRTSAMLLTACTAASLLTLILNGLRRRVGLIGAITATTMVFLSFVFQYSLGTFMADLLTTTFCLAAVEQFDQFLNKRFTRNAVGFSLLATAAILTKQDAIALAAIPPLSVVLTRRWRLLADWRFYLPAVVVGVVAAPYCLWAIKFTVCALGDASGSPVLENIAFFASGLTLAGWFGAILASLGAVICLVPRLCPSSLRTWRIVLFAWVLGIIAIHLLVPVGLEARYKIQILPLAALLAACAVQSVATMWPLSKRLRMVLVTALLVAVGTMPRNYVALHVEGYQTIVDAIPQPRGLGTLLVCSDSLGDGAIASELRLNGRSLNFCMLRADQHLAKANWTGKNYELLHTTPTSVGEYVRTQPVQYIILDDWGLQSTHGELLRQFMKEDPQQYRLLGRYAINRFRSGKEQRGVARLYAVRDQIGKILESVNVTLDADAGGGIIHVKPQNRSY